MAIEKTIKDIILEILDVEEKDVVPTAHLIGDLGATSVDMVEIMAAIENEFDVEISDNDALGIRTVEAIVDYIKENAA